MNIQACLPQPHGLKREPEPIPPNLVGSRIIAIGRFEQDVPGVEGGLVIDCELPDSSVVRTVLNFNEMGMWLESQCVQTVQE